MEEVIVVWLSSPFVNVTLQQAEFALIGKYDDLSGSIPLFLVTCSTEEVNGLFPIGVKLKDNTPVE
eukprot:2166488-Heterocapsa_arctica.AAC.1